MLLQFEQLLKEYDPITLAAMDAVKLLNRVDTKFVMHEREMFEILESVKDKYSVLDNDGSRIHSYRTLYFDTDDFDMYTTHHNDWQNRYKVRCREYVDSGVAFLEIKRKTNKQRTVKKRIQTPVLLTELQKEADEFVSKYYPHDVAKLSPKLLNRFRRITLVSKKNVERLTLDLDLSFEANGKYFRLPNLAIAEVKQAKFSFESDFAQHMRKLNIRSRGFSKYCAGIARGYPTVKQNRFKQRMRHVEKIGLAA